MEKKYYNSINLLRILAAVEISFFYHYMLVYGQLPFVTEIQDILRYMIDITDCSIELFFIISGFIIQINYGEKIRARTVSFKEFFLKRVFRIYPTMILSVVVIAVIQWFCKYVYGYYAILDYSSPEKNTAISFVLSLFGLNSGWICSRDEYSINGPTWYISILMICYVLYFVAKRFWAKTRKKEIITTIGIIVVGYVLLSRNIHFPLLFEACGRGYYDFFLGVLIAMLYSRNNWNKGIVAIVSSVVIICCVTRYIKELWVNLYYLSTTLLVISVFIITLLSTVLDRLSKNNAIKRMGELSFGVYLWNLPTFAAISIILIILNKNVDMHNILIWFGCIGLNIVVALCADVIIKKIMARRE